MKASRIADVRSSQAGNLPCQGSGLEELYADRMLRRACVPCFMARASGFVAVNPAPELAFSRAYGAGREFDQLEIASVGSSLDRPAAQTAGLDHLGHAHHAVTGTLGGFRGSRHHASHSLAVLPTARRCDDSAAQATVWRVEQAVLQVTPLPLFVEYVLPREDLQRGEGSMGGIAMPV